ncbi:GTP 3',8-cyclase MoaA, partial [Actinotalea sp.]|uniref:GTP 3',8-cyclase MoaA n=1 Tax=Actinotalea sp. TaxID=1872145 RepID=UPI003568649A
REQYATLTRRDRLLDVLAGLRAARVAGLHPIKINAVLLRGVNEDQAVPLLRWSLRNGYQLRFIEQMPLGPLHAWDRSAMVTAAEILGLLSAEFDLRPVPTPRGGAPAELWTVAGPGAATGEVGVIGAVSRPFCRACDRTRLTADGQLRTCLFAARETDLRAALRGGSDDAEVAEIWRDATLSKPAGHGIGQRGFRQPHRLMSAIGG